MCLCDGLSVLWAQMEQPYIFADHAIGTGVQSSDNSRDRMLNSSGGLLT